ncbi:hypothetical protein [Niabella ginsengisoli]|uniref:DUF4376 domain-containing protein n=1 Tax=Niabella ginsengisoli TaxID=522298 RepID=A0ABS9SNP2_9BACT|nr:hypothetical protein [Niabella ginsengisoli]MCH5599999.1 hypothetical protein [Niabella ginsengisoli]
MSYDIHITRQESWFDGNDNKRISLDEWKEFLTNDTEMRLDNFTETTIATGELIRVERDGLSVWTKYSGNGLDGNFAWFDYNNGNIVCKNPDNEIINKMLDIAERLNAKVQGDEGELYEKNADQKIHIKQQAENESYKINTQKPWWKFW